MSHYMHDRDCAGEMCDLEVQVTLNDGIVIKPVAKAVKLDRAIEIVTPNMIYVVATTDIVRVSYSNYK